MDGWVGWMGAKWNGWCKDGEERERRGGMVECTHVLAVRLATFTTRPRILWVVRFCQSRPHVERLSACPDRGQPRAQS